MLQDPPSAPPGDGKTPPATQTTRFRAQRIRERTAAGKPMTPEERRFMEEYERRPVVRQLARRRRNAGRVTPTSAITAVASVYGIDIDVRSWRVRGAWCHEAWRVLVVLLVRAGEKIRDIAVVVGCHKANVPRAARRMEEVIAGDEEIAKRVATAAKLAETGNTAVAAATPGSKLIDAILSAHPRSRGKRRVIVLEVDVDSPLWRVIDAWQEAMEIGGLGAPSILPGAE